MNQTDRKPFAVEMFKLAEAFGANVSEARAEAYFEALQEFSLPDIRVACGRAVSERTYFPKAAELIKGIQAFQAEQRRASYVPPPPRERLRCGPDLACELCEVVGCACQGCIDAITKCREQFREIADKAVAGGLFLMRVPPPPPTREATRADYEAHEAKKAQEMERLERLAIAAPDDEDVPF